MNFDHSGISDSAPLPNRVQANIQTAPIRLHFFSPLRMVSIAAGWGGAALAWTKKATAADLERADDFSNRTSRHKAGMPRPSGKRASTRIRIFRAGAFCVS